MRNCMYGAQAVQLNYDLFAVPSLIVAFYIIMPASQRIIAQLIISINCTFCLSSFIRSGVVDEKCYIQHNWMAFNTRYDGRIPVYVFSIFIAAYGLHSLWGNYYSEVLRNHFLEMWEFSKARRRRLFLFSGT